MQRNYLSRSHDGAQRSAMLYSFMEAVNSMHNPMVWLEDGVKELSNNPMQPTHMFLPHNWKENQKGETEKQTNFIVRSA